MTGLYAALGIMAALAERKHSGKGQRIDVSLYDVALAAMGGTTASFLNTGRITRRHGAEHPSFAPCQPYAATDGAVMVAIGNDEQFQRLCRSLDLPDVATDARYTTNADRVENKESLNERLNAVIRTMRRDDLIAKFDALGVPAGPIYDVDQVLSDPQAEARKAMMGKTGWAFDHDQSSPSHERIRTPDAFECAATWRDTHAVLQGVLGLNEDEISQLVSERVVGIPDKAAHSSVKAAG